MEGGTKSSAVGEIRAGVVSPVAGNACGKVYRSPGSMESSGVYLKFLYTGACSLRSKQHEMEALVSSQNYNIIVIIDT